MAETCLSYLNSKKIKGLSANHSPDLQAIPFLEYSSLYWGVRARRDLSESAKRLALKLFDDYGGHVSTRTPGVHPVLLSIKIPFSVVFTLHPSSGWLRLPLVW